MPHGFVDSNCAGDASGNKGTTRHCFSLGSAIISGFIKKQVAMALSLVETEKAANSARCEAITVCKLIAELTDQMLGPTVIYQDNHNLRIQCFLVIQSRSIFSAISSDT